MHRPTGWGSPDGDRLGIHRIGLPIPAPDDALNARRVLAHAGFDIGMTQVAPRGAVVHIAGKFKVVVLFSVVGRGLVVGADDRAHAVVLVAVVISGRTAHLVGGVVPFVGFLVASLL